MRARAERGVWVGCMITNPSVGLDVSAGRGLRVGWPAGGGGVRA